MSRLLRRATTQRVILGFLLAILAACATVPITGRRQLSLIPHSEMVSLGGQSYTDLLKQSSLSQDKQANALLSNVGERIARSAEEFLKEHGKESEIADFRWEFKLIQADEVNAFCLPGGKVGVYTGILPITQDQDGLAVVLGHEIAHAIANHGGERMSQLLLVEFGGMALATATKERPEETRQLLLQAYGLGASVGVILPYSRSHEREADHIGLLLSARAGYDPRAAIPFWERMSNSGGERPPELLSTHPSPKDRAQSLNELLPEALGYYRQTKEQESR